MSEKEEKVVKFTPTYNTKQIFWAILPWAIIALVAVGFAGTVFGWTMRSGDDGRIRSEASVLIQQLKVEK